MSSPGRRTTGRRVLMYALWIVAMIWLLTLLGAVLASILGDADRLVDAGGLWMLLAYLVVPICVAAPWLIERIGEWRENRYYERRGEELQREWASRSTSEEYAAERRAAGWRTLREGDESAREGMASLSAAEKRARGEPPAP